MEIQPFMIDDYGAMIALWERSGLPFEKDGRDSRDSIERQMFDDHIAIITLKEQGQLIGAIIATSDGRKGWINRLAVDPDFRGRRLAARLIEAAEEKLAEMGVSVIGGLIEDQNFPSMAAAKYCGYEGWEHLVYFRKKLNK
ncbi:MAG: GNAT family N-acetyltransferase [candidate division Zixibacteria bacterium]|nr:GNAT family N-acetyltransferase [candidate division Zixibacteria bacterium]